MVKSTIPASVFDKLVQERAEQQFNSNTPHAAL